MRGDRASSGFSEASTTGYQTPITSSITYAMSNNQTQENKMDTKGEEYIGVQPLAQIEANLKQPIPRRLLETKTLKGNKITYCPWYRVQKILDHYTAGFWEYEVREKTITTKTLMLTVRIYIHAQEGTFFRDGTGLEKLSVESFGDPQSNAESMAFRRAAARWGVGLDLYEGDGDQ